VVALLFRSSFPRVATIVGGLSSAKRPKVKYLPYINKDILVVYKGLCGLEKKLDKQILLNSC